MDSFNHLSVGVSRRKIVHFIDYAVIQFNANTSHIWKLYHVRKNEGKKKKEKGDTYKTRFYIIVSHISTSEFDRILTSKLVRNLVDQTKQISTWNSGQNLIDQVCEHGEPIFDTPTHKKFSAIVV